MSLIQTQFQLLVKLTELFRYVSDTVVVVPSLHNWSITSMDYSKSSMYTIAIDAVKLGMCTNKSPTFANINLLMTQWKIGERVSIHVPYDVDTGDRLHLDYRQLDLTYYHHFSIDRGALCLIVLDLSLCSGSTEVYISPDKVRFQSVSESGVICVEMMHGVNSDSFSIIKRSSVEYHNRYTTRDIRQLYNISLICDYNVQVYTLPGMPIVFEFVVISVGVVRVLINPQIDQPKTIVVDWVSVINTHNTSK
jgi:hypothetical protein